MRLVISSLCLVALASMAAGCVDASGGEQDSESESGEEQVAEAASAQLDPGWRTYSIKQSGVLVASAWAGTISTGEVVEYWVSKPSYASTAARTFEGASQSCASWKSSVCSSRAWSGATYRKGIFAQGTLDCELPPGPCAPGMSTTTFLGAGSYTTADSSGASWGWEYSSGACEYWAMHHTIGAGVTVQNPLVPAYTSHRDFIDSVCAMTPVPSTYFVATYQFLEDECDAIQC